MLTGDCSIINDIKMTLPVYAVCFIYTIVVIQEVTSISGCPDIKHCVCSRNQGTKKKNVFENVECFGEFSFKDFNTPSIRKNGILSLNLRNTSERNLTNRTFRNMKLEELYISDQATTFSNTSFDSLSETLHILYLENVNISRTWILDFLRNMTVLDTLYLDRNGIYPERFPDHVFSKLNLTSLTYLSLRNCGVAQMSDQALHGLESLESLDLSNNHLPTVPKTILLLRNLKKIDLSHNARLIYVEDRAFMTLQRLEEIDLSHTGVNTLLEDSFEGLEECLQIITIHHAKMAHGYFSTMRKLRHLIHLDISYNYITEMHNTSFLGFSSLQELDVSGQRDEKGEAATNFIDSTFRGLETKLLVLKMRDLQMTSLPLAALTSLRILHVLDVSDNNFTELYESFFYGVRSETIYVQNCSIGYVNKDAFDTVSSGVNIYLDNNNIKNISFILDTAPCQFRKLSFTYNPVQCDCDVIEIASSNMVPELVGACADELYRGENLAGLHEFPIARNGCDAEHFQNSSLCTYMIVRSTSSAHSFDSKLLEMVFLGLLVIYLVTGSHNLR